MWQDESKNEEQRGEAEMKEIEKLMNYRPEIRVVDATLRDGGLVNNFFFTDEFVKALYLTNLRAGVDYMEFGYKASKEMFSESKFGKWKFCKDEDIRAIVGENATDLKIAVMADVGRCDYKNDILPKAESPIDMIRVATYIHTIPAAIDMIEDAVSKGYETTCNLMALTNTQEKDLQVAMELVAQTDVKALYIVDSYGAIYPEQLARVVDIYRNVAAKYGKEIGIHAHNNQQLAFANTIEAVGDGANFLDATYNGMGRGAGNCAMELLLSFLKNPKYNAYPVFQFVQNQMTKLKEEGVVWGYDLQYLMTGILNQHPRAAIAFTEQNRKDYADFYCELIERD